MAGNRLNDPKQLRVQLRQCRRRPLQNVRFQEEPSVLIVVEPLTPEDKTLRWYSPNDLNSASEPCFVEKAYNNSTDKPCRKQFIQSLLQTQLEHQRMGIRDPKGLFQLSKRASKKARERAMKEGLETAEEARRISNEETRALIDDVLGILGDNDF